MQMVVWRRHGVVTACWDQSHKASRGGEKNWRTSSRPNLFPDEVGDVRDGVGGGGRFNWDLEFLK